MLRLGVATLMVAGAASVWELLALQAPGTPLYIGMLPGPVGALRELSGGLGVLLVLAGLAMPWTGRRRAEPRRLVAVLYAGTLLALTAQTYGAAHGMHGVQLGDLRRDALPLFVIKHAALALVLGALIELGRRVLLARGPGAPRQLDPGKPDH